tara:strand:- start:184 stop:399 length:216 start_codon:yes stop_codon:yes gene_type:complete
MISTDSITSRLSIFKTGGINASGLNVLSEEYSYPISTILTSLILPIEVDTATILAFVPFSLITDLNFGSFL